jgi:hypothetical protein
MDARRPGMNACYELAAQATQTRRHASPARVRRTFFRQPVISIASTWCLGRIVRWIRHTAGPLSVTPIILVQLTLIQPFDLRVAGVVAAIVAWVHIGVGCSSMRGHRRLRYECKAGGKCQERTE